MVTLERGEGPRGSLKIGKEIFTYTGCGAICWVYINFRFVVIMEERRVPWDNKR